jgi:hypothetical protein
LDSKRGFTTSNEFFPPPNRANGPIERPGLRLGLIPASPPLKIPFPNASFKAAPSGPLFLFYFAGQPLFNAFARNDVVSARILVRIILKI